MIHATALRKEYPVRGRPPHVVLDDVSFSVPPGLRLALLGRNGAGKSTLIRMLSKIELPTSGRIEHRMSVSWPLAFTGSFQGSLTGIDNARFLARIYRTDFKWMLQFVEEFAELGDFLYEPVKTYSWGMRARLAFALSIAIEFDCYLIDEVLMVGDQRFHARCQEHLFARRADRALIIATHDLHFAHANCDAAIVLDKGKAQWFDDVTAAVHVCAAL